MIHIINHPLIEIKLTVMRDEKTNHKDFKANLNEISSLMVYEILRDYKAKDFQVKTSTGSLANGKIFDKEIVIVPILRAGLGMTDGISNLVPQARIGHIGLYRDEKTFEAKEYFYKIPDVKKDSLILVVDPMLATGGSANDAIKSLKKRGFSNIKLVCLVGVKDGIDLIEKNHPDVNVYLAAKDDHLDKNKYIIPGLGDAGDRIFGTK
ncbi:uracil phosphoribosyltransferase [[Mycoplasma] mobile]|uniref:Uracil phosphoribosyltransferase n=1 Tax=Mycoplasma mobile (strain ATCC 43663 / 163K / NCTC 11711) TaxID=267748 RepID=UPP_MYCM1|nr:uracil phosphoribosyltransferase [[Mycoplasma] mobile]Q6KHA6.1 RecName: Full=Uracil phosphoribosyltransferase; AltName: Full=UMP pyrophosphorylase; AltName: Full=UPRTase [Mycoplasma mobile 163K]AAT28024.1 uracil phosphoribosyltransferase [Mycoplasma mobile 163K]